MNSAETGTSHNEIIYNAELIENGKKILPEEIVHSIEFFEREYVRPYLNCDRDIYYNKHVARRMDSFEGSISEFRKKLANHNQNAYVKRLLSNVEMIRKRVEAHREYRAGKERLGGYHGSIHKEYRDYSYAIKCFENALSYDPGHPDAPSLLEKAAKKKQKLYNAGIR